jgi:hypothetical protein
MLHKKIKNENLNERGIVTITLIKFVPDSHSIIEVPANHTALTLTSSSPNYDIV